MGLRFRKSVTIAKGVRLNFGKTGMSVTFGSKGYHKTIHQNGNVTTTTGIPGTGIYWTETKNIHSGNKTRGNQKKNNSRNANLSNSNTIENASIEPEQTYHHNENTRIEPESIEDSLYTGCADRQNSNEINNDYLDDIDYFFEHQPSENYNAKNDYLGDELIPLTKSEIYEIYKASDLPIDWTEILVSTSPDEVYMDGESWDYYKSVAKNILKGDIDTYLKVIEDVRPLDDLLAFGGNFEFGTDSSGIMEIEFDVMPEEILGEQYSDILFWDYVCATSIRVARDTFALLPVSIVIVHTVYKNQTILSVLFNRREMERVNYNLEPNEIIDKFKHNGNLEKDIKAVNRIQL